jgi:hypothetical protein
MTEETAIKIVDALAIVAFFEAVISIIGLFALCLAISWYLRKK